MSAHPVLQLGDVANVVAGDPAPQDPKAFASDGPLFVRMQDVGRHHRHSALADSTDHLSSEWVARSRLRLFPKDSILIPKSGASVNLNHRAKLATDAYVVSHLAIVIPDRTKIEPDYLYWWSANYDPRAQAQVTSLPSLKLSTLKSALVPLPPLDEQRQIVNILNRAARIERLRKQAQERLQEFIPALFIKMFGDPAENPMGWEVRRLEDLVQVRGGKRLPKGSRYSDEETPYRYIRATDITAGKVIARDPRYISKELHTGIFRYIVHSTDTLMTIAGKIGIAAPADGHLAGANLTENVARLTPLAGMTPNNVFLSAQLNSEFVQAQIRARTGRVTIGKLALQRIKSISILVPPLTHQINFSKIVEAAQTIAEVADTVSMTASVLSDILMSHLFESGAAFQTGQAHGLSRKRLRDH